MPKGETRFVHTLTVVVLRRRLSGGAGLHSATAGRVFTLSFGATSRRFYTGDTSKPPSASSVASGDTFTEACGQSTPTGIQSVSCCEPTEQPRAATSDSAADAAGASSSPLSTPPSSTSSAFTASPEVPPTDSNATDLTTPDPEPVRWVQPTYQDSGTLPIVDEKGEYIVSRVQWPTGEVAYRTPPPVDDKLAPRFGYNVVQVRKHVSWWKYNQKYPRLSIAYINIQVLFLLGLAWLVAFLTSEYRHTIEAMRTPGAMVGEHRGKGPATNRTQKISFEKEEMNALLDKAQSNWYDGKAEASYVGSKAYKMKKIPRPTEFSADDFRKSCTWQCQGDASHRVSTLWTYVPIKGGPSNQMSVAHSLALPLSADYARNDREGFSFFCKCDTCDSTTSLDRYLDDLCAFLRNARLIQCHPDNYFQLIGCERLASSSVYFDGSPVEAEELARTNTLLSAFKPLLHGDDPMSKLRALIRDGPPTDAEQCAGALAGGVGASTTSWSPGSPPSLTPLREFYAATRRLMLGRARRVKNDAASFTLLSEGERLGIDCDSSSAQARRQHEQDILDLVVSQGMSLKKQHEVPIMRMTIRDLVLCCNAGVERTSAVRLQTEEQERGQEEAEGHRCGDVAPVRTVINIGEGKGYVSRAVSLCDNLQVVGLDCNPAHKERAVERFESLVETSLSSRDRRTRVNLLYEPHGYTTSIACRVGEKVDWKSLLHGHVRTCAEPCCLLSKSCSGDTCLDARCVADDKGSITEEGTVSLAHSCGGSMVKLACRVCGKIVRQDSTTSIMKHIYRHLHRTIRPTEASREVHALDDLTGTLRTPPPPPPPQAVHVPVLTEVQQWNASLPQHVFVAKLTERFFTATDVHSRHLSHRKDAVLLNQVAVGGEHGATLQDSASKTTPGYLTLVPQAHGETYGDTSSDPCWRRPPPERTAVTLEPAYIARGYRVMLLIAVEEATASRELHSLSPASSRSSLDGGGAQAAVVTPTVRDRDAEPEFSSSAAEHPHPIWSYVKVLATVVGYDGGVNSHQVCLDQESKKRTLRLYRLPADATAAARECARQLTGCHSSDITCVGDWQLPDAETWGHGRIALILTVLPPTVPSTPMVCVPRVRNTVLVGLHSCGDLGSNMCRIFRNSSARGLLLVSCCWHALTPQGFPLSRSLQRRGWTTDSISLLLATQPLDAWSAASPEGHCSSAKLLFFRSLFKLLWRQLAGMWEVGRRDGSVPRPSGCAYTDTLGSSATCAFPDMPPHLEPAFLRRMARDKDTLTFAQLVHAIAAEYVYSESSKATPYTPWGIRRCCAVCRKAQEAFVRYVLTQQRLPETMGERFEQEHFASFLGLTVLRMWMCHLVESLLLLDRTLYLHEELSEFHNDAAGAPTDETESSAVALVPLFDGALSPRMYGILARRGGSASA